MALAFSPENLLRCSLFGRKRAGEGGTWARNTSTKFAELLIRITPPCVRSITLELDCTHTHRQVTVWTVWYRSPRPAEVSRAGGD
jgi:hypothetical protein